MSMMANSQHLLMEFIFSIHKLGHMEAIMQIYIFILMDQKNHMLIETKTTDAILLLCHRNLS